VVELQQGRYLVLHAKISPHYPEFIGNKSLVALMSYTNQIQTTILYSFHPLGTTVTVYTRSINANTTNFSGRL